MGQLVDELKPKYEGKVNFLVIFLDEEKEQPVADEYNVQFVPMTILFDKDGDQTDDFTGVVNRDTLTKRLTELAG